eukprot:gene24060-29200_t
MAAGCGVLTCCSDTEGGSEALEAAPDATVILAPCVEAVDEDPAVIVAPCVEAVDEDPSVIVAPCVEAVDEDPA